MASESPTQPKMESYQTAAFQTHSLKRRLESTASFSQMMGQGLRTKEEMFSPTENLLVGNESWKWVILIRCYHDVKLEQQETFGDSEHISVRLSQP